MLTFGPEPKTCMKQICGHHRKKRCIKYLGYLDLRFVWNMIGTRTLGCRQMSEGQMREQKGGNAPPEKERRVIWTTIGVLCKKNENDIPKIEKATWRVLKLPFCTYVKMFLNTYSFFVGKYFFDQMKNSCCPLRSCRQSDCELYIFLPYCQSRKQASALILEKL